MPKLKTKKTAKKRIQITGKKNFLRRYTMQNHFNARQRGKNIRAKRRNLPLNKTKIDMIKKLLPYN